MRFLHTSDWHVGKPLRNHRRDDEYATALEEVLEIIYENQVDAVLVAGDVYDSAVPSSDAERIVFDFFAQLARSGIPSVVIAGNHDHPRRWNAYAPVLEHAGITVIGEPASRAEGGVVSLRSRSGSERAVIAALPWVSERKVRDFDSLMTEGKHFEAYAQGVTDMIRHLCAGFEPNVVNILLAHVYVAGAVVGPESGERPLHVGDLYAITPQAIPPEAQYAALGHVHNPEQPNLRLSNAYYSGSLLQCDFGEAGQQKGVRVVDVRANSKAKVEFVPLTNIRQLRNIGSSKEGLTLDAIAAQADSVGDAYCKVFVKADRPVPGLAEQVRELIPNAVDIVVERLDVKPEEELAVERMSPAEAFAAYYGEMHAGGQPAPELMALFNRLYEESTSAAD
jgi:exonuclease SbcD